jgi:hypothetical protein
MKLLSLVLASFVASSSAAFGQTGVPVPPGTGPRLQLDHLDRLSSEARETVNLSIDPTLLKMAAGVLGRSGRGDSPLAALDGIEGIYIRSFEFERDNVYAPDDVDAVRKQLEAPGWSRLIEVDGRNGGELVQIYNWREGDRSRGLALLVAEPRELTVINIVGTIDFSRLGDLRELGIPGMPPGVRP